MKMRFLNSFFSPLIGIAAEVLAAAMPSVHASEPGPLVNRPIEIDRDMLSRIESPVRGVDITAGKQRTRISASIPLRDYLTFRGSFSEYTDRTKADIGIDFRMLYWLNRSTFDFNTLGKQTKTASSETGSVEIGIGARTGEDENGKQEISPTARLAGRWDLGPIKSVTELAQPLDRGNLGIAIMLKYPVWRNHYLTGRFEYDGEASGGIGYGIEF